ncbi:hypothetical protein FRC00_004268 [Tulasnella sp. 408]|nr:hypothetical protein FRC00_004268 [Tulasnella sp. 408]
MNAEVPGLWRSQYETIPIEILPPNLFQVPDSLGGGIPMESHNLTYHYPPVAPKSDEGQPTGNPESSHDGPMLNFSPGEVMRPVTDDDTRVFKPLSAAAGGSPFEPFYPPLRLEAVPSHHLTNPLRNVDFQQYDIPQLYLTPQESSQSKVLQPDNEPQVHTRSERTEQQESSGPRVPTLGSLGRVVPPAASVPNGQTIDDHAVPQPQQPQLDVDDIREILDLLRRNDRAQKIALDQQREVIRHLSDMNSLLERDAVDRQIDMTSLAAGLVSLPDEVAQRRPLLF